MAWLLLIWSKENRNGLCQERLHISRILCVDFFISRRLLKIRIAFMEGDKKRVKEPDRIEEAKTNPQRIQEYEFFVNEGEGETEEALPEDRHAKVIKRRKGGRNKSRTFFLD